MLRIAGCTPHSYRRGTPLDYWKLSRIASHIAAAMTLSVKLASNLNMAAAMTSTCY